jgi:hypothetical protein
MKNWTNDYDLKVETRRLISSHTLKRCVLCGAVNAVSNEECFVCRWHGEFDTDPTEIECGVNQLLDRCPELAMAMIDNSVQSRKRAGWFKKLAIRFAELLRRH